MNKKILMSLVVIGVVAAIVAGTTGAWWTDEAKSTNTSFHSGNMDLQLANSGGDGQPAGGWHDDVTQTWDYQNMVPAGASVGSSLWLRNNGDTPADWLKFETETDPSPVTMNEVMRITKLAYAGKTLLENGAGADLSGYEGPEIGKCDLIVDGVVGDDDEYATIQKAVHNQNDSNGDGEVLICVRNGTYNENVVVYRQVGVTEPLIIKSLNGPEKVTIDVPASKTPSDQTDRFGFIVVTSDVTIEGFKIVDATVNAATNTTNDANRGVGILVGTKDSTYFGYVPENKDGYNGANDISWYKNPYWEYGNIALPGTTAGFDNNTIRYNIIEGASNGIIVSDSSNILVENNKILDSARSGSEYNGFGLVVYGDTKNSEFRQNTINGSDYVGVLAEHWDYDGPNGNCSGSKVIYNEIENGGQGIYVLNVKNLLFNFNNLAGNAMGVVEEKSPEVNAENNWWGDFDPSDQVEGKVDYDPYLGGPHIGFINGNDQNGNGFADLEDLHVEDIVVGNPQLDAGYQNFELYVQLDGPTSTNNHQDGNVGLDMTVTMGQGPAPSGN